MDQTNRLVSLFQQWLSLPPPIRRLQPAIVHLRANPILPVGNHKSLWGFHFHDWVGRNVRTMRHACVALSLQAE